MEDIKDYLYEKFGEPKRLFLIGLIMTIPFLFLVWMSFYDWGFIGTLDELVGAEVYEERRTVLNTFFILITRLGNPIEVGILTAIVAWFAGIHRKNEKIALWYVITVVFGAGIMNQLVKFFFQRERPDNIEHLITQGGYSFPSGHAMGSVIVYGALLFLIIRTYSSWKVILPAILVLVPLIGLIGFSRIYLGVHYPSDIIGGYSLGLAILSLSLGIYSLFLSQREIRQHEETK